MPSLKEAKEEKVKEIKVKDLKAGTGEVNIELEIVSLGEPRAFSNFKGQGTVAKAAGKDSEGKEIAISLWNEQIKQVNEGDKIRIENGWVSEYNGEKQLSTGKFGTLTVLKE